MKPEPPNTGANAGAGGDAAAEPGLDLGSGAATEVVASGTALAVVSRWLGMSAEEAEAEAGTSASGAEAMPARRPAFLGLGAKFLPHHKGIEAASILDNKLRRRLERGLAARRAAAEDEDEETGGAGPGPGSEAGRGGGGGSRGLGRGGQQTGNKAAGAAAAPGAKRTAAASRDSSGTDSDEGDRKAPRPRAAAPVVGSRAAHEALMYAPVGKGGGKTKRGKKGKGGAVAG